MKPATQFLELIVKNPDAIFKYYIIREENRKSGIEPIMKYYKDCPTDQGNVISVGLNGMDQSNLFPPSESKNTKRTNMKRIVKREKTMKKIV